MNALIVLSILGATALFSELFDFKKIMLPVMLLGLIAALIADVMAWNSSLHYYNEMMIVDNYAVAFTGLLIAITLLWFILSPEFFHESTSRVDHFALIIFALIGGQLLTSYGNLLMLFLGIEILSIPLYILAGSRKTDESSNEASIKYFLMGSFATGFLLFGIALIYGATGSFNLQMIAQSIAAQQGSLSVMMITGIIMMMIGFAFKVSVAPFHFWTPDVYTGSPTVVTAFMSTVVKTAGFAGFLRLFLICFNSSIHQWSMTVWVLSAITIIVGNVTAVYQTNFKRLLAYSGIAHAGYMLLAILALNHYAQSSMLFYAAAYSVSTITAFGVLLIVSHQSNSDSIESFNGLAKKNPLLAGVTILSMLSLAGIPPMAGFFAKYYLFTAAIEQHYTGLVTVAVLGSLVGVYYYFRIIIALFKTSSVDKVVAMNFRFKAFLVLTSVITLLLGLAPQLIVRLL
jgi:NADH-quinone oxidoreductase subunit N